MLQLLGAVMIFFGIFGIGYSYVEMERKLLTVMEKWERILQLFSSEITYKKQPLSMACQEIGQKIGDKEGKLLKRISDRMLEKERSSFSVIWNEESEKYCRQEKLGREFLLLLEEFQSLTGMEDEEVQLKLLEEQKEKWKRIRAGRQRDYQERKRVILILSSCIGLLLIVILW